MSVSMVKKSADTAAKESKAAFEMLSKVTNSTELRPEQVEFLWAAGVIQAQQGYQVDREVNAAIARVHRIGRLRAAAGLGGEYDRAKKDLAALDETTRTRKAEIQEQLDKLNAEMRELDSATREATQTLKGMEQARTTLSEKRMLPSHVQRRLDSAVRAVNSSIRRELLDAEGELKFCKAVDDVAGKSESEQLDFVGRVCPQCRDSEAGKNRVFKYRLNDKWAPFLEGHRKRIPDLQTQVEELQARYDAARQQAELCNGFWLKVDPWG